MHGAFAAEQISELANTVAVELLAESGQNRGPGPRGGWNVRHMVVIKIGV